MYITTREKAIIETIIKTSGKHTAATIAKLLNVSTRTIHRDLKTAEKILEQFQLKLTRNTDEGLIVDGKNEHVFRLIQHLMAISPIDETPNEKKLQLLLELFGEESIKIQTVAGQLGISVTTLTTYLEELTPWLDKFQLQLTRKRGVGVEVIGKELYKRKALASFFLLHFHEELIERLFLIEGGEFSEDKILYYFVPRYLLEIERKVNEMFNQTQSRLADTDYIGFIIHIYISLQRTAEGFLLDDVGYQAIGELESEYDLVRGICNDLESQCPVSFTNEDISYLAVILKGSKLHATDTVPYDSIMLGKKIKRLIQNVSSQINVDLTKDFSLYNGLLTHMEPSLFRIKQKMSLFNPLTEEIKRKYPVLFIVVRNSIEMEFKEMDYFPEDEIAFIVLHFGSALVLKEERLTIKALIICPTGIGTSKMLASRLKKEILEIDSIEVKSIKSIRQQEDLKKYDVIISTVRLPFINLDYILVSPLLSDENKDSIRNFLRKNIGRLTKNKNDMDDRSNKALLSVSGNLSLNHILEEMKDIIKSIEAILHHFHLYRFPHLKNHDQVLWEMVRLAEQEQLVSNPIDVMGSLKEREKKGGLGIPQTGMALFHCRNKHINHLLFRVAHLHEPIVIKGMDGQEMKMKNLLLMLAPEELSVKEQEIVSLISTSIIENRDAVMIFSSSDERIIRSKLEAIFVDYLQKI